MRWRLIPLESRDAYSNMAIDDALIEGIAAGTSAPTIRFYTWKPSAVSIGQFQSMREEVNTERCSELGVSYVRRITGGGAVYHMDGGELTYSVVAPIPMIAAGIKESYRMICGWVVDGLNELGISSSFVPINDIITDGKKISGNAQARSGGVLLQHGTVLYDLDVETMFGVLNVSKEKISDKMIKSAEERVTCVSDHATVSLESLYRAMKKSFSVDKEFDEGYYTEEELKRAEELAREKYVKDSWNFER